MIDLGFKERMALARWVRSGVVGEQVTQKEIAKAMAKRIKKGIAAPTVSRHFSGRIPEQLNTVLAYAEEMGVDPGWLAFGPDRSKAPAPEIPAEVYARLAGRKGKGRKKA